MSSGALTLKLTGALKRLPRAIAKPVAMVAVGAVALGGLTLAQSWTSRDAAEAVTFYSGWDGVFTRDQLWYHEDYPAYSTPFRVENPGAVTSGDLPWRRGFDPAGYTNGWGYDPADANDAGTVPIG
ncbi:MAG: hypothetical protein LBL01_01225, partial [Bifidobacteriaceae bacterium]|nr:hypothetical protein [Bifidobacteriaceae bacterium]